MAINKFKSLSFLQKMEIGLVLKGKQLVQYVSLKKKY